MKIFNKDLTKELQEKDVDINKGKLSDTFVKIDDVYEQVLIYTPYTDDELKERQIALLKDSLEALSQDFIQAELGAVFEDLDERKERFKSLHNELRQLLGKEPREYITEEHEGEE